MNATNTITLVANVTFSDNGEDFEAGIYSDGYIEMWVWGASNGIDYDYRHPSSIKEEMEGSFEPGSRERKFAYAAAAALVSIGRSGWWYSRSARDEMGLDPEAGDLMARIVIDWADL